MDLYLSVGRTPRALCFSITVRADSHVPTGHHLGNCSCHLLTIPPQHPLGMWHLLRRDCGLGRGDLAPLGPSTDQCSPYLALDRV